MAFTVQRIDHVEVFVRDIAAAARWYAEVLGLEEVCRWDPEPVMIGAGDTKLALFLAEAPAPAAGKQPPALRWHRVAWRTNPSGFEAAQEHLRRLGVPFEGPLDHRLSRSLYFHDPDGHPLEITTYRGD